MTYSHEVEHMCVVKKGPNHGPAPIPEDLFFRRISKALPMQSNDS